MSKMTYRQLKEELPVDDDDIDSGKGLLAEDSTSNALPKPTDAHLGNETTSVLATGKDWKREELEEDEEEEELNEGDTVTLLRSHRADDKQQGEGEETEDEESEQVTTSLGSVEITTSQAHKFKWVRYTLGIGAFVLLFAFLATAIALIAIAPPCRSGGDNPTDNLEWWKTTIIYQCYPRSFQDSNRDGNGDLRGIMNRADYFLEIGAKTLWLNPIFRSPQKDGGYDISNFTDIDPLYGTLDDLKALLKELHSKGLKLLLDFVPNHTSDEHPWFIESRSSKNNPKRDWYIWTNGTDSQTPPNNWVSVFGGSAWTYDNVTGQYYFHQFAKFQPDLNYRNPEVRQAMEEVLRFWLDMGVDGFRFDAVKHLLEDPELRDEKRNPSCSADKCTTNSSDTDCYNCFIHNLTTDYTGIHNLTQSWRKVFDTYKGDRLMVGEIYDPIAKVMTYYGEDGNEFNFPFNFQFIGKRDWNGTEVNNTIYEWLDNMPEGAWPNWVFGNHDNPRVASTVGNTLARAMNVFLLTLPGTPTTYYGEEIFMTDVKNIPNDKRHDTVGNRDNERTPMQWDMSANAGFTPAGVDPWLPVASNYSVFNVEVESADEKSMLSLYRKLARMKSQYPSLRFANYTAILSTDYVLAYNRYHESSSKNFTVVINFGNSKQTVDLYSALDTPPSSLTISLSSNLNRTGSVNLKELELEAGEALVLESGQSCG